MRKRVLFLTNEAAGTGTSVKKSPDHHLSYTRRLCRDCLSDPSRAEADFRRYYPR